MKKIILILLLFIGMKGYSQCDTLTTYTVTNITGTSAKITWPVTPDINYYEIFVIDITNDTTLIYSNTSYPSNTITLTGLNPNRTYWVYISFICNTPPFVNPVNPSNHYLVFSTISNQITYTPMTAVGYQFKYLKADSMFHVSNTDTLLNRATTRPGAIVCRPQDSLFYGWNGAKWAVMGADVSSLVSLINQKVDSVIVNGDSLFYWVNGVSYGQVLTVGTTNIYNSDGVLTGDRYMDQDGKKLLLDNGFYGTNVGNIRLGSDYGVLSLGEPLSYESPSEIQAQTELSIHVNGGLLFNVSDSIKTLVRFPQSSLSTDSLLVLSSTGVFKTRAQSAVSGLITASNGLTKSTSNIKLGGPLTENTMIDGDYTKTFDIDGIKSMSVTVQDEISLQGGAQNYMYGKWDIDKLLTANTTFKVLDTATHHGLTIADTTMKYSRNLGSAFTTRSLVDKGYVDSVAALTAGTVTSVSGTSNRITSTGGATPVIDISSSYVGQSSITTLGTIGTGTWQGGVIAGQYGGTGVANTGKKVTLGGNLTTSGAFALTLTQTNTTNVTLPTTGTLATLAGTETLSNKRITPRVTTIASSSTPTPDGDASDVFTVTALAANATFAAPTGTPVNGQQLLIRILDNGTARTLAWNAIYRASTDFALPTTTVLSKTMYLQFIYNRASTTWDAIGYTNGF